MTQPLHVPAGGDRPHAKRHDQPGCEQYIDGLPVDQRGHQHEHGQHDQAAVQQARPAMELMHGPLQRLGRPGGCRQPGRADEGGAAEDLHGRLVHLQRKAGLDWRQRPVDHAARGLPQGLQGAAIPAGHVHGVARWELDHPWFAGRPLRRKGKPHRGFGAPRFVMGCRAGCLDEGACFGRLQGLALGRDGLEIQNFAPAVGVLVFPEKQGRHRHDGNEQRDKVDRQGPQQPIHAFANGQGSEILGRCRALWHASLLNAGLPPALTKSTRAAW